MHSPERYFLEALFFENLSVIPAVKLESFKQFIAAKEAGI
jgi:hypothetical protein